MEPTNNNDTVTIMLLGSKYSRTSDIRKKFVGSNPPFVNIAGFIIDSKNIEINNRTITIKIFEVIDINTFEQFVDLVKIGCEGVMLVFNLCDLQTFNSLSKAIEKVNSYSDKIQAILVGNCCKLIDETRSRESYEKVAKSHNWDYIEVDDVYNTNISNCFILLAEKILNKKKEIIK